MNRQEYYDRLIKELNSQMSVSVELKCDSPCDYAIEFAVGDTHYHIHERSFDKFHTPMSVYSTPNDVIYKDCDISIAISNIKYEAMELFRKQIFPPKI